LRSSERKFLARNSLKKEKKVRRKDVTRRLPDGGPHMKDLNLEEITFAPNLR